MDWKIVHAFTLVIDRFAIDSTEEKRLFGFTNFLIALQHNLVCEWLTLNIKRDEIAVACEGGGTFWKSHWIVLPLLLPPTISGKSKAVLFLWDCTRAIFLSKWAHLKLVWKISNIQSCPIMILLSIGNNFEFRKRYVYLTPFLLNWLRNSCWLNLKVG